MSCNDRSCQCPSDSIVVLDRGENTSCTVHLHGATVISWKIKDEEQLFVSRKAIFDGKKAIRGGIPFVFPQFGPWKLGPQHGFARITKWNVDKEPEVAANGDIRVILTLMDTEQTRSMWNYKFKITYTLLLGKERLHFSVAIDNLTKDKEFTFTLLLHTYFKVSDVRRCVISGLKGCYYIDKAKDGDKFQEDNDEVTINEFTDRIYEKTPSDHILTYSSGRKIRIHKCNFPDTVIWNPWVEQAKAMADFDDEEYINMVCIEAGYVTQGVVLQPNTSFEAIQTLEVI